MRTFTHIDAYSINETCELLGEYQGRAKLNAGGTDLLSTLKGDILPDYPEAVLNVKTIPDLDYIREEGKVLKIGALTQLTGLVGSSVLKEKYGVLFPNGTSEDRQFVNWMAEEGMVDRLDIGITTSARRERETGLVGSVIDQLQRSFTPAGIEHDGYKIIREGAAKAA